MIAEEPVLWMQSHLIVNFKLLSICRYVLVIEGDESQPDYSHSLTYK